ncbi:hypothetical protein F5884DRAFT_824008 [Xylogone sp. PMI_703]|nr:hypothetical protein F5884DRAFT_824008 [Xylogone sp. PMI_703]
MPPFVSSESTLRGYSEDPRLRSRNTSAPLNGPIESSGLDAPTLDSHLVTSRRERNAGEITSSPPTQRSTKTWDRRGSPPKPHPTSFCTLRCLKNLSSINPVLDYGCPNVKLHRPGGNGTHYPISTAKLIELFDAPFKITCLPYSYTDEVKQEADMYRVLQHAQGLAVPTCFLHGAGQIRHMLLMAWGGEKANQVEQTETLKFEFQKSLQEVRQRDVEYGDFHLNNVLWNAEIG